MTTTTKHTPTDSNELRLRAEEDFPEAATNDSFLAGVLSARLERTLLVLIQLHKRALAGKLKTLGDFYEAEAVIKDYTGKNYFDLPADATEASAEGIKP